VILLAAVLVLAAIGLLAAGLIEGSATLQWASFGASALAALVVVTGEVRRNLAARAGGDPGVERREHAARTADPRPDRLTSDRFPAVPPSGPPSQPLPQTPRPYEPQPYEPQPHESQPHESQPHGATAYEPTSYDQQQPYGRPAYDPRQLHDQPAHDQRSDDQASYDPPPYVPPPTPPADDDTSMLAATGGPHTGGHQAGAQQAAPVADADGEPPVEEVEVTDLLVVLDLTDEVLVIDEHPRYHLAGCPHVNGRGTFAMPMVEARTDGFTPCATCAPDRNLARVERARRAR
jgi:hypothetical protein